PFLILATPLAAQSDSNQIVVTGTPIEDSARALADCLARGCSPEEDITLTLAHAENQFVAGEYKDGDQTLNKSISRNKKHKAEVPELLAGLYRASARFSEHLGEPSDFKFATLNMRDTLRDVFGEDDRRVLIAQTEVGDSRAKLGSLRDAQSIYTAVEQRALELNYPRVASFARLRQALLQQVKWSDGKQSSRALMNYKAALTQLITEPLPNSDDFSLVAQVLQARLLRELEKPEATDQLIATFLAKGGTEKPILLYNEPFESITESLFSENSRFRDRRSNTLARLTTPQLNRPRYIDIGFWIRPDGTTAEVEILREQGTNDWHGSVLAQIASRRYAPLKLDATSPGLFHIERYTQTAR
ncbi:MAG: hypothetical protein AAGJ55_12150, partial [Cyanobacteria bacterium J06555_12]